jgi:hypothetical protein
VDFIGSVLDWFFSSIFRMIGGLMVLASLGAWMWWGWPASVGLFFGGLFVAAIGRAIVGK